MPTPYLSRNRAIVDETEMLIATPAEFTEQQRSGTWSTVRYARACGKKVAYSDEAGRGFRSEAGRCSDVKPATIPI